MLFNWQCLTSPFNHTLNLLASSFTHSFLCQKISGNSNLQTSLDISKPLKVWTYLTWLYCPTLNILHLPIPPWSSCFPTFFSISWPQKRTHLCLMPNDMFAQPQHLPDLFHHGPTVPTWTYNLLVSPYFPHSFLHWIQTRYMWIMRAETANMCYRRKNSDQFRATVTSESDSSSPYPFLSP